MKTYTLCLDGECSKRAVVDESQIEEFFSSLIWISRADPPSRARVPRAPAAAHEIAPGRGNPAAS